MGAAAGCKGRSFEEQGDDPVKASTYGLANLKRVAPKLAEWTATSGEGYGDLAELYGELLGVWSRFAGHVTTNVGGMYELLQTTDEKGFTYTPILRAEQERSMDFLIDNVFSTPTWLLQENILRNIGPEGVLPRIRSLQERQLNGLLRKDRLARLVEQQALNPRTAYPLTEMLGDLRAGLWNELPRTAEIDAFRRNLQRSHVDRLAVLMKEDAAKRTDVSAAARAELKMIAAMAKTAAPKYKGIARYHLEDVVALVEEMLDED